MRSMWRTVWLVVLFAGSSVRGFAQDAFGGPEGAILLDSSPGLGWDGWSVASSAGSAKFSLYAGLPTSDGPVAGLWFAPLKMAYPSESKPWTGFSHAISPWFTLRGKGNLVSFRTYENTPAKRRVFLEIAGDPSWRELAQSKRSSLYKTISGAPGLTCVWLGLDSHSKGTARQARLIFSASSEIPVQVGEGWMLTGIRVTRQDVPILSWGVVPGLGGTPAMATLNGQVHVAAVGPDGILRVTSTDTSGLFTPAQAMPGPDRGTTFNSAFPPVLMRLNDFTLSLFAVSSQGHLCRWNGYLFFPPLVKWYPAVDLAPEGGVVGRPSVALTDTNDPSWTSEVHIVFKYKDSRTACSTRYLRWTFQGNKLEIQSVAPFPGGACSLEPSVTSDGQDRILILYPYLWKDRLAAREAMRSSKWSLGPVVQAGIPAATPARAIRFRDCWMAYYGSTSAYSNMLSVFRISEGEPPQNRLIWLQDFDPWTLPKVQTASEVCPFVYEGSPLVLYRDLKGAWRYVRLGKDSGPDENLYLEGHEVREQGWRPFGVPAHAPAIATDGSEVYIACRGAGVTNGLRAIASPASVTYYLCLTRSIFKARIERLGLHVQHFEKGDAYHPDLYPPIDCALFRLPVYTQIGKASWDFPEAKIRTFFTQYKDAIAQYLEKVDFPSESPVHIQVVSWDIRADTYPWRMSLDPASNAYTVWSEWGHWMFWGSISGQYGTVPLFSDEALLEAKNLFYQKLGGKTWPEDAYPSLENPPDPNFPPVDDNGDGKPDRFRGFDMMYCLTSPDHAWIDCLVDYVYHAADLRKKAQSDAEAGFPLLRQKYDWIRWNVWNGVEF